MPLSVPYNADHPRPVLTTCLQQELAHGRPPLARMNPMRVLMDTMTKPPPRLEDHPNGKSFSKVKCRFCYNTSIVAALAENSVTV